MTQLAMIRDVSGLNSFGLPFSETKYATTLAAGVAQSLTVPHTGGVQDQWLAIFAPQVGASIWVANNATAAVPGSSFATITSENNPTSRFVKGGDVLSFITSDDTATIGVTFYSLQ